MTAKILVAEGDESLISFLEPMLKRAGFQVVIARDGEEALALAAAEEPDLVVLDKRMPELDGWGGAESCGSGSGTSPSSYSRCWVRRCPGQWPQHQALRLHSGVSGGNRGD